MKISEIFHKYFIYDRRMSQLHNRILDIIDNFNISQILDIGAGDGKIDRLIMNDSSVKITGIDVLVRNELSQPINCFQAYKMERNIIWQLEGTLQ